MRLAIDARRLPGMLVGVRGQVVFPEREVDMPNDGRRWPGARCDLRFHPTDWPAAWRSPARDAMDEWNGAGANFTFAEVPAGANWVHALDRGQDGGVLAVTVTSPTGTQAALQSATVEVNSYYDFRPRHPHGSRDASGRWWWLDAVLTHELGHALHLCHSADPNATMYHSLSPMTARGVGSDDQREIQALYP